MTHIELMDLLDACHRELTVAGTTFEAEQIKKRIELAREQMKRPAPARDALRALCEASRAGKHMDRYQDSDVIALWTLADRALEVPFVPGSPREDMQLAFEEDVTNPHTWFQGTKRHQAKIGSVVQVWTPVTALETK